MLNHLFDSYITVWHKVGTSAYGKGTYSTNPMTVKARVEEMTRSVSTGSKDDVFFVTKIFHEYSFISPDDYVYLGISTSTTPEPTARKVTTTTKTKSIASSQIEYVATL